MSLSLYLQTFRLIYRPKPPTVADKRSISYDTATRKHHSNILWPEIDPPSMQSLAALCHFTLPLQCICYAIISTISIDNAVTVVNDKALRNDSVCVLLVTVIVVFVIVIKH